MASTSDRLKVVPLSPFGLHSAKLKGRTICLIFLPTATREDRMLFGQLVYVSAEMSLHAYLSSLTSRASTDHISTIAAYSSSTPQAPHCSSRTIIYWLSEHRLIGQYCSNPVIRV